MDDHLEQDLRPHARGAAQLLKALAHEERLMIVCHLLDGEKTAGELWRQSTLSQSAFSQHLAVLRGESLIVARREAQTIYYAIADGPAQRILETLHCLYCGNRAA